MPAPIVSFYDENGANPITKWNIGEVDAGSDTEHLKFTIWNNKAGSSNVSNMKNVRITTVNENGGESGGQGDVVVNQNWVKVIINNKNADAPVAIGGSAQQAKVFAAGVDPDTDGYIISGEANDGTKANSPKNYALAEAFVSVPANADEGQKPFIIRVPYSYT
jgi:hypothetical protein